MTVPGFFFPGLSEPQWHEVALTLVGSDDPERFAYSIRYRHDGGVFTVTVGECRREQRIIKPPRRRRRDIFLYGSERLGVASTTGGIVLAIVRGDPFKVYEIPGQRSSWGNPSYVGEHEIESLTPFGDGPIEPENTL
jgi:hypothetical protein